MLWMLGLAVSGQMSPSVALHRISLRQVLSPILELTDWLDRLSSESQGSLSLHLSIPELQTWASMFGFYMRAGDLNPGPHVCTAVLLLTEPPTPVPDIRFLRVLLMSYPSHCLTADRDTRLDFTGSKARVSWCVREKEEEHG